MNKINIRELRVIGLKKDYSVVFNKKLNIIAGEISTGKSSILDLIDYCLGAKTHPQYPEIQKKGRIALLEVEFNGEIFVIERQLFSTQQKAQIHFCNISTLKADHKTIEVNSAQKKNEESISSFILSKIDLFNIPLKEAPKKDLSDIDLLSLRDVLWFCYLKKDRVAGNNLLFENDYMKAIKLRQVFEVIFEVYSQQLAFLSSEIALLDEEIKNKKAEIKTILDFVDREGVPEVEELEEKRGVLLQEVVDKQKQLKDIDSIISSKSELASGLRKKVLELQSNLEQIRREKRGYEKTLQRLIPLRGQYSEDITKLHFLKEAKRIIDPLRISICPICLSSVKESTKENLCPLCGKDLPANDDVNIDVSREIRTIERKLKELNSYAEEIEEKLKDIQRKEKTLSDELLTVSHELDETLKNFVSPYLSERESLVSTISSNQNEMKHIGTLIKTRTYIKEIHKEKSDLETKFETKKKKMEKLRENSPDQKELISSISKTFSNHLLKTNFPKLSQAYINEKLVPFVRGIQYDKLSSEGAINLASICWITAIYSEAIQKSSHHPGFLMLDGIQRGIGLRAEGGDEEFRDEAIIKGVYVLLKNLVEIETDCKIIVVDNHPPIEVQDNVVVCYSGNSKKPPYGFIDDETS
jgi:DNA repair exonuclease SbcCD ATPase subunit